MSDLVDRLRACVPEMVGAASAQCTDVEAVRLAADEIERLREATHQIGAMFYMSQTGAVLLKGEYGNYDVLEAANAALTD